MYEQPDEQKVCEPPYGVCKISVYMHMCLLLGTSHPCIYTSGVKSGLMEVMADIRDLWTEEIQVRGR